jgi:hypothetical protein
MADDYAGTTQAGKLSPGQTAAGCPAITLVADEPRLEIHFDFGQGCTTDDGEWHQGKLGAVFEPGEAVLTFDDYANEEAGLDGRLRVVQGPPLRHYMEALTLTQDGAWVTFDTELAVSIDLNEPFDPEDNEAAFTGSGRVENSDGESFAYTITDDLIALGNCEYAVRGEIDARFTDREGHRFDAEVDYFPESGGCDDLVAVRIEGETILTHLDESAF